MRSSVSEKGVDTVAVDIEPHGHAASQSAHPALTETQPPFEHSDQHRTPSGARHDPRFIPLEDDSEDEVVVIEEHSPPPRNRSTRSGTQTGFVTTGEHKNHEQGHGPGSPSTQVLGPAIDQNSSRSAFYVDHGGSVFPGIEGQQSSSPVAVPKSPSPAAAPEPLPPQNPDVVDTSVNQGSTHHDNVRNATNEPVLGNEDHHETAQCASDISEVNKSSEIRAGFKHLQRYIRDGIYDALITASRLLHPSPIPVWQLPQIHIQTHQHHQQQSFPFAYPTSPGYDFDNTFIHPKRCFCRGRGEQPRYWENPRESSIQDSCISQNTDLDFLGARSFGTTSRLADEATSDIQRTMRNETTPGEVSERSDPGSFADDVGGTVLRHADGGAISTWHAEVVDESHNDLESELSFHTASSGEIESIEDPEPGDTYSLPADNETTFTWREDCSHSRRHFDSSSEDVPSSTPYQQQFCYNTPVAPAAAISMLPIVPSYYFLPLAVGLPMPPSRPGIIQRTKKSARRQSAYFRGRRTTARSAAGAHLPSIYPCQH